MNKSSEELLHYYGLEKYNKFIKKYLAGGSDGDHHEYPSWRCYAESIDTFFNSFYDINEDDKITFYKTLKYLLSLATLSDEVAPYVSNYVDTDDKCYDKNEMRYLLSSLRKIPEKIFWREMAVLFEPIGWLDDPPYDTPHFLTDVQNFLNFCSIPITFKTVGLNNMDLIKSPIVVFPHQWWAYMQSPCETCPKAKDKR